MTDNIGGANDLGETKSSEIEEWKRGGVSKEGIWFTQNRTICNNESRQW